MTSLTRRVYTKELIYQRENTCRGSGKRAWLSKSRSIQPRSSIEQELLYLWDGWTSMQAINTIYKGVRYLYYYCSLPKSTNQFISKLPKFVFIIVGVK